ncbi:MAG: polysaccharide lyase [Kiritimatiellales bacterium]|nr:polysaccharide lyase [Kiritimatiellales bacterium]
MCKAEPPTALIFVGDFEKNGLKWLGNEKPEPALRKTELVTTPVRHGNHALKLALDRMEHKDVTGYRTDFWIKGMSNRFDMHEDYWYGFSTYWPDSWQPDTQPELFVQWVGWRAYGPSLAIYIYGEDYCIKKRWAAGNASFKKLWGGNVAPDAGRWVDWVFHVRWSASNDGLVEAWKNGNKIVSDEGRNCGPGEHADYFKFGIYKWPWKQSPEKTPSTVTQRILYIDEIRIGDKTAGLNLFSPPCPEK